MSWTIISPKSDKKHVCCGKGQRQLEQKRSKKMAISENLWAEDLLPDYKVGFKEEDAGAAGRIGEMKTEEVNVIVPPRDHSVACAL